MAESYVNVVAPVGADVVLDGRLASGFRTVGATGMAVVRLRIASGVHTVSGDQPIGIMVYGFGPYTSYLYPGGLDFREISPPF